MTPNDFYFADKSADTGLAQTRPRTFSFVSEGKTILNCTYQDGVRIEQPPSDAAVLAILFVGFIGVTWLLTKR